MHSGGVKLEHMDLCKEVKDLIVKQNAFPKEELVFNSSSEMCSMKSEPQLIVTKHVKDGRHPFRKSSYRFVVRESEIVLESIIYPDQKNVVLKRS